MAWSFKRHRGCWYGKSSTPKLPELISLLGPAHAVYFATYEVVKQAMGGNEGTEHHPLAAGTGSIPIVVYHFLILCCSYKWGMCHNRQRCADEPFRR